MLHILFFSFILVLCNFFKLKRNKIIKNNNNKMFNTLCHRQKLYTTCSATAATGLSTTAGLSLLHIIIYCRWVSAVCSPGVSDTQSVKIRWVSAVCSPGVCDTQSVKIRRHLHTSSERWLHARSVVSTATSCSYGCGCLGVWSKYIDLNESCVRGLVNGSL